MTDVPQTDAPESVMSPVPAIIEAAMALAAAEGWSGLRLADIAAAAGLPLIEVKRHVGCKAEILIALARHVDAEVLGEVAEEGGLDGESVRDALFDLLMRRFDVLTPWRPGIRVILDEARRDPALILPVLPQLGRSMAHMLAAAGDDARGPAHRSRVAGLCLLWLGVVRVWLHDDSADLSATMAGLDKALGRAELLANSQAAGPMSFLRDLLSVLRRREEPVEDTVEMPEGA